MNNGKGNVEVDVKLEMPRYLQHLYGRPGITSNKKKTWVECVVDEGGKIKPLVPRDQLGEVRPIFEIRVTVDPKVSVQVFTLDGKIARTPYRILTVNGKKVEYFAVDAAKLIKVEADGRTKVTNLTFQIRNGKEYPSVVEILSGHLPYSDDNDAFLATLPENLHPITRLLKEMWMTIVPDGPNVPAVN